MKDILQLLKEQSAKMKKLSLVLRVIQGGMRQNTPVTIKASVKEAAEVLHTLKNGNRETAVS